MIHTPHMAWVGVGNKNLAKITCYVCVRGAFASAARGGVGRDERTRAEARSVAGEGVPSAAADPAATARGFGALRTPAGSTAEHAAGPLCVLRCRIPRRRRGRDDPVKLPGRGLMQGLSPRHAGARCPPHPVPPRGRRGAALGYGLLPMRRTGRRRWHKPCHADTAVDGYGDAESRQGILPVTARGNCRCCERLGWRCTGRTLATRPCTGCDGPIACKWEAVVRRASTDSRPCWGKPDNTRMRGTASIQERRPSATSADAGVALPTAIRPAACGHGGIGSRARR
jgi:hypothetical protein